MADNRLVVGGGALACLREKVRRSILPTPLRPKVDLFCGLEGGGACKALSRN